MKGLFGVVLAILFLSNPPSLWAEYIIYLKGGHYIIADNCTFSSRKGTEKGGEAERELILVEECTIGEPEGPIFWSTIDGKFGEIDANNVFAIYGGRGLRELKPPRERMPLEDYLITNRGESFVNAKDYEDTNTTVYGMKRDELARVERRGVADITPEGLAKSRSGEGLCPGEAAEFSVTETELVGGNLIGVVTNLSKAQWKVRFEVEVQVKGKRLGKFQIEDPSVLPPDDSIPFDEPVPSRFLKHVERVTDPDASVRICYRKVKTGAKQPSDQARTGQPPK
ncbi:MAG: hypothetical protein ACRD2L_00570 [Terriglobia bacterium]